MPASDPTHRIPPRFDACRAIVFDLDGTLIDSYDAIAESLNTALESLALEAMPREQIRTMVGRGLESLVESALRRGGAEAPESLVREGVRLFRAHYDRICVDGTRLLPGVSLTVPELARRGYRMAVATNKPSCFARRLLDALGIGDHMGAVFGPDLVRHPKPDPGMVHAAMRELGVSAAEAVYVGDMEIDVQTARAAGLGVIVMPTGSSARDALEASGADHVADSFTSLLDLLPGA